MLRKIVATVLFVRDLDRCITFYRDTLGLPMENSDADSAAFRVESLYLLLLAAPSAADLIGSKVEVLKNEGGPSWLQAAEVEDVDAAYEMLKARGIIFLKTPIDQPWGLRTAHFTDPEGNVWEINQPIVSKPV